MIKLSNQQAIAIIEVIAEAVDRTNAVEYHKAMKAVNPMMKQFCAEQERRGLPSARDDWDFEMLKSRKKARNKAKKTQPTNRGSNNPTG